jgi:hypothetical protein
MGRYVHHKDGDPRNNDPSNLEIRVSRPPMPLRWRLVPRFIRLWLINRRLQRAFDRAEAGQ